MADTLRSDGKAVEVVLTADVLKGAIVGPGNTADGFQGIAMEDALSGATVAIEIAQREHELNVGGISAAKGAVLYLDATTGAVTATVGSNKKFLKVTVAKDSNNYVWGILLPQS